LDLKFKKISAGNLWKATRSVARKQAARKKKIRERNVDSKMITGRANVQFRSVL